NATSAAVEGRAPSRRKSTLLSKSRLLDATHYFHGAVSSAPPNPRSSSPSESPRQPRPGAPTGAESPPTPRPSPRSTRWSPTARHAAPPAQKQAQPRVHAPHAGAASSRT